MRSMGAANWSHYCYILAVEVQYAIRNWLNYLHVLNMLRNTSFDVELVGIIFLRCLM